MSCSQNLYHDTMLTTSDLFQLPPITWLILYSTKSDSREKGVAQTKTFPVKDITETQY